MYRTPTLGDEKKYIEIGIQKDANYEFNSLIIAEVGFCMLYWVLFGIWATINAYHTKRSNVAWVAILWYKNEEEESISKD